MLSKSISNTLFAYRSASQKFLVLHAVLANVSSLFCIGRLVCFHRAFDLNNAFNHHFFADSSVYFIPQFLTDEEIPIFDDFGTASKVHISGLS